MPAAGARFAIARFNLPATDPPRPLGIFVVFLVDDAEIVTSTSSGINPTIGPASMLWEIECTGYVSLREAGTHFNPRCNI
jgi:hypothetical protein